MASKRMLRALKSTVRQNIRAGKEKKFGREQGLTTSDGGYINRKARSWGTNSKKNTRSGLWTYAGDDPAIKKAQQCFKNNVMRGQDSESAYSACGLGYSRKAGTNRRGSSHYGGSSHKRHGMTGIYEGFGDVVVSSEWVDKRS